MENKEKEIQEILEKFKGKQENVRRKLELLNSIRERRKQTERTTGVSSIRYDNIKAHTNNVISKVERIAIKNIQFEMELEEEIEWLNYQINIIEGALWELRCADEKLYRIAYEKFIENKTWRCVGYTIGLGERQCMRIGKKAIEILATIFEDNKYSMAFLKRCDEESA